MELKIKKQKENPKQLRNYYLSKMREAYDIVMKEDGESNYNP